MRTDSVRDPAADGYDMLASEVGKEGGEREGGLREVTSIVAP